jgi:hypothetical protein
MSQVNLAGPLRDAELGGWVNDWIDRHDVGRGYGPIKGPNRLEKPAHKKTESITKVGFGFHEAWEGLLEEVLLDVEARVDPKMKIEEDV